MNNKVRLSLGFKLYHRQLYVANPISLLYEIENNNDICNICIGNKIYIYVLFCKNM